MSLRDDYNAEVPIPPPNPPPSIPVALVEWKPMVKGALRGFATIRIGRSMILIDCPVCTLNGRTWATLPSKPQIGKDGGVLRDAKGKILYTPLAKWADRTATDRFSEAVVAAVISQHGDVS